MLHRGRREIHTYVAAIFKVWSCRRCPEAAILHRLCYLKTIYDCIMKFLQPVCCTMRNPSFRAYRPPSSERPTLKAKNSLARPWSLPWVSNNHSRTSTSSSKSGVYIYHQLSFSRFLLSFVNLDIWVLVRKMIDIAERLEFWAGVSWTKLLRSHHMCQPQV